MPNLRRLAYRDRYVWSLTQTSTGGASALPPIYFIPGEQTQFIVSLDQDEFTRLFTAILTGADLSYPEQAHEVVWSFLKNVEFPLPAIGFGYQSETLMIPQDMEVVSGAALAFAAVTANYFNIQGLQTPAALNDAIFTPRYLVAGNYRIHHYYSRNAASGNLTTTLIPQTSGDPVDALSNIDMHGTALANQLAANDFVLDHDDYYHVYHQILSKHASSTGYLHSWSHTHIWRLS